MKLLVEVRLASPNARDTRYVPVVVDAKDGGDAQRKAIAIAAAKHPNLTASGGPVCPATPLAIEEAEDKLHEKALTEGKPVAKPRAKPEQRGVKAHPLDEQKEVQ